jgi:hypothetical protein
MAGAATARAQAPAAPPDLAKLMSGPRLFTSGSLARNPLALMFAAAPADLSPDPALRGVQGPQHWSDLKGKPHLVSLWSETCAPCLAEAGDLAALAVKYRDRGVGVVAILTGSQARLDLPRARALLAKVGAADLPLWIEPDGGGKLWRSVAGMALPCNLLVDDRAVIRGRAFGSLTVNKGSATPGASHVLTDEDKHRLLEQRPPTAWTTPYATQLMDALAAGALRAA